MIHVKLNKSFDEKNLEQKQGVIRFIEDFKNDPAIKHIKVNGNIAFKIEEGYLIGRKFLRDYLTENKLEDREAVYNHLVKKLSESFEWYKSEDPQIPEILAEIGDIHSASLKDISDVVERYAGGLTPRYRKLMNHFKGLKNGDFEESINLSKKRPYTDELKKLELLIGEEFADPQMLEDYLYENEDEYPLLTKLARKNWDKFLDTVNPMFDAHYDEIMAREETLRNIEARKQERIHSVKESRNARKSLHESFIPGCKKLGTDENYVFYVCDNFETLERLRDSNPHNKDLREVFNHFGTEQDFEDYKDNLTEVVILWVDRDGEIGIDLYDDDQYDKGWHFGSGEGVVPRNIIQKALKSVFEDMYDYFGFNGADEELTEAYYNEGGQKIACVALTSAAVLAMAFGITQCNNKIADGELNKLDCLENYKKYNLDNQEGILHSVGIGDTHSKAMYAAIVSNAREKGMSIEESARDLTKNWKKKLSSEFRNFNSVLNQEGAIKAVRVGKGSDGTRIVEVTYQYRKRHTSGSGENKHTYHTTETGYVFIPCSEANQYGVDDIVDNGHHTVNIGGATFEFDEDASFANTYRMTSRDFNMWRATTKGLTTVKELDEGKAFACYIPEFSREYGRQMPKHIGTYVPSEGVLYCDDTKYFGHLV